MEPTKPLVMSNNAAPDASPTSSLDIHALDTESSDNDTEFAVAFAIASVAQASKSSELRQNGTLSGKEYVDELLNRGTHVQIQGHLLGPN